MLVVVGSVVSVVSVVAVVVELLVDVLVDVEVGTVVVDVVETLEVVVGTVVVDELVVWSSPEPPASANTAIRSPITSAMSTPIANFWPLLIPP